MTTIVERDASGNSALLAVIIALLIGAGVAFAYWSGAFGNKTTVIENNKTIEKHEPAKPAPVPESPSVPEP